MSSTDSETASARPARWRALIALFGVAMFALGVGIGGLGLPRLLALNPVVTPQASVVAQAPLATATATGVATTVAAATPATATLAPPAATAPPPTATNAPTATVPPPTATTPLPAVTATLAAAVAPTPTVAPTNPTSAIFAPDPEATATTTATAPTAAGTATSGPTITATVAATATASATGTPTATPTPSPTIPAFAATDRINTEIPVNFRAGPGTAYAAQAALPPGTLLAAIGETATVDGVVWRQFSLADGTVGWVRAQDVLAVR